MTEHSTEPVVRIVNAIAEAEEVDPLALDPPLAVAVDPNALETLLEETTAPNLEVSFSYRDHDVVVDADGQVDVS